MVYLAEIVWQSLILLPLAVVAAMCCALAVAWLYPAQVRGLRQPVRWALPALRGAALVVLVLSMLKPVAVQPITGREPGAVAVLVDRSRSMSAKETGRTPAERVELAASLGRLPSGTRSE